MHVASPVDPDFYAGLSDPDSDPFTAFAPTNEAFEKLFDAFDITAEDALSASPEEIDSLLKNHGKYHCDFGHLNV